MTAYTSAWHAVPDAVGVAGQWRPADLRGLPATLRYGPSLPGVALAAARGRPTKVLLHDDCGPVTGTQLEASIDAMAAALAAAMRAGPRREIGVCSRGHRGLIAAIAAAGALGIDITLVPPSAGREVLSKAIAGLPVVVDPHTAAAVRSVAPDALTIDAQATALRSPGRSLRTVPPPRRRGTVRLLTSGTSGAPKSTARSGAGVSQLATVLSLMHALDLHRDGAVIVAPPLSHGHGLSILTAALVVGAPAVLAHGRDGAGLIDLVHEHAADVLAVVPGQLVGVLQVLSAERSQGITTTGLPSLRRVATGSAPLDATTIRRAQDLLGDIVVDFYGSSELGTATIATPKDLREAPGTVGRPAAGVRVEVVDDEGVPVPTGVVGHVRVRSPWRAQSTAAGTIPVGDRGHFDDQGRLFLDGRDDDVVVVGGHNVSISQVHSWFAHQVGVDQVTVTAVPHARLGQELDVVVTGSADLDDLRQRALTALGSAFAPRRIRGANT